MVFFFFFCSLLFKIFSIYLLIPGLVWYVVFHIDLRRQNMAVKGRPASSTDGLSYLRTDKKKRLRTKKKNSSVAINGYTFRRGRHSGSFFLKIGAAGNNNKERNDF